MTRLTIGALAKRTGVSVRRLRHYDEIGLLRPAARTGAGYRLYGPDDVRRLQAIVALRQLGLGLSEIGQVLNGGTLTPGEAIALRLERLDAEIAERQRLHGQLRAIAARMEQLPGDSLDDLVASVEVMTAMERIKHYYSPEQLQDLARRRAAMGDDAIKQAERDWAELIDEVKQLIADGVPPSDPHAKAAAARWSDLVRGFTGGDPGISRSLQDLWENETNVAGFDTAEMRSLGDYIAEASKAAE